MLRQIFYLFFDTYQNLHHLYSHYICMGIFAFLQLLEICCILDLVTKTHKLWSWIMQNLLIQILRDLSSFSMFLPKYLLGQVTWIVSSTIHLFSQLGLNGGLGESCGLSPTCVPLWVASKLLNSHCDRGYWFGKNLISEECFKRARGILCLILSSFVSNLNIWKY